jgi:tetratricopeptide (TPR) repeat protein
MLNDPLVAWEHRGPWNREGVTRLEPELPNTLAIIQWCFEQQLADLATSIFLHSCGFMIHRGYWKDAMALGQQALTMSTELRDELKNALFRLWPVGWLYRHWGDLDSAEEQVTQALAVFEQLGRAQDIARTKRNLGRIFQERGELEQAEQLLREALAFYQSIGDERHIYLTTTNLADVFLQRGDLDTAWVLCDSVLTSARQFGDPERIAHLLKVLGGVARQRGNPQRAKQFWEEALSQLQRTNRLDGIADAMFDLAQIEIEVGREQPARQMLSKALEAYRRLGVESRIREVTEILTGLSEPTDHTEREGMPGQ